MRGAPLLLAVLLAGPGSAQEAPPADPIDLINSLLAGLLGFRELTGPELQREVAEAGGVPFRREVGLEFLSRAELARYLKEVLDSEYPESRARAEERTLVALDLLPAGTDLRALRSQMLEQNVVGFYDERPGRKRLYAVSENRSLTPANQLILSHELRHALQDQYVDVHTTVPATVGEFDDRRLAFLSLLEGDATLVMERFLLRRLPEGTDSGLELPAAALAGPALPEAPAVVSDQLVKPYLVGLDFARAVWKRGGWEAVRAAWSRPPESTEQVLHPEKYFAREAPRPVDEPDAPRSGRLLNEGVLGELLTRTLVEEPSGEAASGWGGDRFRVFDMAGRTLLLWGTSWDSVRDADEFSAALRARLARTHSAAPARAGHSIYQRGGFSLALRQVRGSVLIVSSDEPRAFDEALAALGPP